MNISITLHWVYNTFLDFLSPPCCSYCKDFLDKRAVFCMPCMSKLQPVVSIMMPITATKSVKVFAAAAYKEPIRTLIMAKSWSDHVASVHLADLIWDRTDVRSVPFDYVVPVPLHWTRFAKRGFNQAQEIAQVLSKKSGTKSVLLLKRSKRTPFQSVLKSSQRVANVADAFVLTASNPLLYKDKHLVLVDDLLTTGATIRACAKVLLELKPASITVVVAC
ncbi:MAG: phosphoribosyltransferase family protein, partial [Candidatus Babeliales bacterium]|nr:phosphoribosyltransferase family protein [Candidatus Babeliales bacterium]